MTLEVGQLYEWTEGASSGIRLVRALRIKTIGPYATCTVEHWRGKPDWRGRTVLWPADHAHHYALVTPEVEKARQSKPKKVRRKTALER
jgi:hypothetical protein